MELHNIAVTELSSAAGVSRKHLSRVINQHVPVSADLAARLGAVFGISGFYWLHAQSRYDLYQLESKNLTLNHAMSNLDDTKTSFV